MNQAERSRRGTQMDKLERDDLLNEAIDALVNWYMTNLLNSEPHDSELREECYRRVHTIRDLQRQIITFVDDGTISEMQLRQESKLH